MHTRADELLRGSPGQPTDPTACGLLKTFSTDFKRDADALVFFLRRLNVPI